MGWEGLLVQLTNASKLKVLKALCWSSTFDSGSRLNLTGFVRTAPRCWTKCLLLAEDVKEVVKNQGVVEQLVDVYCSRYKTRVISMLETKA